MNLKDFPLIVRQQGVVKTAQLEIESGDLVPITVCAFDTAERLVTVTEIRHSSAGCPAILFFLFFPQQGLL